MAGVNKTSIPSITDGSSAVVGSVSPIRDNSPLDISSSTTSGSVSGSFVSMRRESSRTF